MTKFSFSQKKELLIPNQPSFKPLKGKDGRELSGDETLKVMARTARKFKEKNKIPVPIPDQKFVKWLEQAEKMLNEGKTSEQIFKETLV